MPDRDAEMMAAADALMDEHLPRPFGGPPDWKLFEGARAMRDAIASAIVTARSAGEEQMREAAAEVAEDYRLTMVAAIDRLGPLGRPTTVAECKEDAAESIRDAIRALPLGGSAWRPMESAPKDGTPLLITRTTDWNEERWHVVWWDADEDWWVCHDGKFDHPLRGPEPTSFMLLTDLPTPPEAKGEKS